MKRIIYLSLFSCASLCNPIFCLSPNNQPKGEWYTDLAELTMLEATEAYEATSVTVIITGTSASSTAWNQIMQVAQDAFGTPTTTAANASTFVIARNNVAVTAWFELLAEVETKFALVESTIQQYASNQAFVSLSLQ